MIWLEVLVEGASDVPTIREVLTRRFRLNEGENFRIHPHKGKGALPSNILSKPDPKHQGLLHQLPAKLRGFGKSLPPEAVVLVVVDADDEPCHLLLEKLQSMLRLLPVKPRVLFGIAVEETESWFLADIAAIERAYPGQLKKSVLRAIQPDAVVGAWEMLARALGMEPKVIGPGAKVEWARRIAPHLDLNQPQSPSFKRLIDGVANLLPSESI